MHTKLRNYFHEKREQQRQDLGIALPSYISRIARDMQEIHNSKWKDTVTEARRLMRMQHVLHSLEQSPYS